LPERGAIELAGAALAALGSGALWWEAEATLIVADLHLEKGSAFAARGTLLPPYDTRATLARLDAAIPAAARRVICLGDSFHDDGGPARLDDADVAHLKRLTAARDWLWIAGNHDPAPPASLGGRVAEELRLGPLTFRHIAASDADAGEVSGHYHPKARLALKSGGVAGPCFIHDARRLVLPAFGAYAGGLDVGDPPLRALFPGAFAVAVVARNRVLQQSFPA